MNEVLNTILQDTYSLTQLKYRIRILKSSLLRTFFGNQNENLSTEDLDWLKSLPQNFYQRFNKDNVYEIFGNLEQTIGRLVVLTIYLAFRPDDATVKQIGRFTRKAFDQQLLLDIRFDSSLIAGAALSWKGVYRDYSLRSKVEERKVQILEGFKKFLR